MASMSTAPIGVEQIVPVVHGSARQIEVLRFAALGLSDKEIAARLRVRVATVRTHLCRVYAINGFKNRCQAACVYGMYLAAGDRDSLLRRFKSSGA
jgi:DNA-binding NarL/FixJ family response regulator